MACKNEQCGCKSLCEVKSEETIECRNCEQYKLIASWWQAKIKGLRDKDDEEEDEE